MRRQPTREHLSLCVSGMCFSRQQGDIILSSSSSYVWGLSVSSLYPSHQALLVALHFQGLNLRFLSIVDQFEPVCREELFVSPGIFRQGHVAP